MKPLAHLIGVNQLHYNVLEKYNISGLLRKKESQIWKHFFRTTMDLNTVASKMRKN